MRERGFEVRADRDGGVVVLSVHGILDALTAPSLTKEIAAELSDHPTTLIVDLSDVSFLDSAGMAAIVGGHAIAGSTRFAVVADGPVTARPMSLVDADLLIDVYPTLVAALVSGTGGEGWL